MDEWEQWVAEYEVRVGPRPERCPECGSDRIAPVVYGLPTSEAGDMAQRGEVFIGGCTPMGREWGCTECQYQFPGRSQGLEPIDG